MSNLLESWVDDHADAMYRFALRRVKDQHAIEDILQETFLSALKAQESFRGDSEVRTWLIAILRLKIVDYYRKQSKDKKIEDARIEQSMTCNLNRTDKLTEWNVSPSNTLESQEFWAAFYSCVSRLPETLSQAYLMKEIDGCASTTICETLNISPENLAVRIFRARAALRDCLDANWFAKE